MLCSMALVSPPAGTLVVTTEFGLMHVAPGEVCVVQRGMRFSVGLQDTAAARGYVLEVFAGHFQLPDLGPIGGCTCNLLCQRVLQGTFIKPDLGHIGENPV